MRRYGLVALAGAVLGALGASYLVEALADRSAAAQEPRRQPVPVRAPALPPAAPADDAFTPEERVNIWVYENCNRSVVNISTTTVRSTVFWMEVPEEGAGSGSVLDKQGHILTNAHVVSGARQIEVTLNDGKSYEAHLVGKDDSTDVAVLKIDAPPASLHPVALGDSTRLRVGQRVFAIGNPFGLERTLTTGVISSLDRTLPSRNHRKIRSVIQIDAAINPGNSGGPLLDSHGRLIGMNTAIASATGQSAGVGFAIPVANIARVVPQLVSRGKVVRPDAGIEKVVQTEEGLLVVSMAPKGPAEQAGLRGFRFIKQRRRQGPFVYETQSWDRSAADLIVAVDGQPSKSAADFLSLIESHRPGEEAILTIVREGRQMNVAVRLVEAE